MNEELIQQTIGRIYPYPPRKKISVLIGMRTSKDNISQKQDEVCSAWNRAGMNAMPDRYNESEGLGVIELIVNEDIDREFAEEIAYNELGEDYDWIAFNPEPSV